MNERGHEEKIEERQDDDKSKREPTKKTEWQLQKEKDNSKESIHSLIHSLIHPFIHSLAHPFIPSFIH